MAVFRSVENRRTTIRGTNSGMTCLITPDGTIQGEMEPFKMGYKIWEVPVFTGAKNGTTIYTRTIDISAKICVYISQAAILCAVVLCILKVVRKRKEKAKKA